MTNPMVLIDVCGTSLADALLLVCPKAEWHDKTGDIRPDARTLFFELNGGSPRYVGMFPFPVRQAWQARKTIYFSTASDAIRVVDGHDFANPRKETVIAGEPTDWGLWGVAGSDATHDTVFVGGRDCIYVRRLGAWARIAAPQGAGRLNRGHGLSADECYFGSEQGLLRWDGQTLTQLETPDESAMSDVYVLSDEELLATTGSYLYRWRDASGWSEIETECAGHGNFASLNGHVYMADWDAGVQRIEGSTVHEALPMECRKLRQLSDGIVALPMLEASRHAFFDGSVWTEFEVPQVAPGALP